MSSSRHQCHPVVINVYIFSYINHNLNSISNKNEKINLTNAPTKRNKEKLMGFTIIKIHASSFIYNGQVSLDDVRMIVDEIISSSPLGSSGVLNSL